MASFEQIAGWLLGGGVKGYYQAEEDRRRDEMAKQRAAREEQGAAFRQLQTELAKQNQALGERKRAARADFLKRIAGGQTSQQALQGMLSEDPTYGEVLPMETISFRTPEQQEQAQLDQYQKQLQIKADYQKNPKAYGTTTIMIGDTPTVVAFDKNNPGNFVPIGAAQPKGYAGTDLAFAAGPEGQTGYFPKTKPLPQGFQWSTPSEQAKSAKAGEAVKERRAQEIRAANIVLEDIGRAKDMANVFTTGFGGNILANIPGTEAADLERTLSTIKSNVGFDRLQQMRNASPTGGALGSISDSERKDLSAVMGSLEQSQSKEQFLRNLDRLERVYMDIVHGPGNWEGSQMQPPSQGANMDDEATALINKYTGGK